MNESQYIYLQNKRWRAITTDWNILSQNSNQISKLYCLTDFQVAWLLSVTEYFRWSSRWENCPCTQSDLDAMKAEMEYNLMSCFDFQAWQVQSIYADLANQQLTRFNDLWNGTEPSSVNPDAPDDFFDGDGSPARESGLCTALTLWVYSYAIDWSTKAGLVLGLSAIVTAIADLMIPAGGDIATEVISNLIDPTEEEFYAMQDITALDTIICDWKPLLEGTAINPTNWTNTVQSLSYTSGTNADLVQQILANDTQLLSNFLTFVNSLGKGYEYANVGAFICPDCPEPVTEVWDFTIDDYGEVWVERPSQAAQMEYISGQGWRGSNPGGSQLVTGRYSRILEVSATYTYSATPGTGSQAVYLFTLPSTIGALQGSLPYVGDFDVLNEILVVVTRSTGTWTATINSITITGYL